MGSEKLTAGELADLRSYYDWSQTTGDTRVMRLLAEHASLERELAELRAKLPPPDGYQAGYECAMGERNTAWRELAELREAANTFLSAFDRDPAIDALDDIADETEVAHTALTRLVVRALLRAASEPAREPSETVRVDGDRVKVVTPGYGHYYLTKAEHETRRAARKERDDE